jgi:iron(III) transport system substrate-binding protein
VKYDRRQFVRTVAMSGVLLTLGSTCSAHAAPDAALIAAAEKEGQLVVYGDLFTVQLLVKSFNAKYPNIKVTTATGDAWQIYNRFISENQAGRPVMDVFWQAEDTLITASAAGSLAPIKFSEQDALLPMALSQTGTYFRGNGQLCLHAWNASAFGKSPAPNDWTDFVNARPEWDGLIATTNPASSSATFAVIASLYQHFGPEKGGQILKGLRANKTELVASMGVMTTKLETGERPLDFFTNTNAAMITKRKGVPVEIKVPESGAVAQFNAVAISKVAPHPNAAQLFVENSLGKDAQTDLSNAVAYPMRKDVSAPTGLPALNEVKLLKHDLQQALKDREAILQWWSESTGFNYR